MKVIFNKVPRASRKHWCLTDSGPAWHVLGLAVLTGCAPQEPMGGTLSVIAEDGHDLPLVGASPDQLEAFAQGDALFDTTYAQGDGLGPLYIRQGCGSCHAEGGRGPGFVQKMAIVEVDGVTPDPDQSALPFGPTVRPYVADGASTAITPPTGGWPDGDALLVTTRQAPPILGRGYLEAVAEEAIRNQADLQAESGTGIAGRVAEVEFHSAANPDPTFDPWQIGDRVVGRFGLKARNATLDDFAADALQGDMGMTSDLRPDELPNPDGLTDDRRPGVDLTADTVNAVALYMRLTEIPDRDPSGDTPKARQLFADVQCALCHAPSMPTRSDYPVAELAGIDAPVFTDLLLHDMGDGLADGQADEGADSAEWRTAPLIGLRFERTYLHDGRAASVAQAIALHGGEGAEAASRFANLSSTDQAVLLAYVQSL